MPDGNFQQSINRSGPFDQLTACFYYCNIVCAIEFLHGHGLVSRDVKPENFLVGPDGYLVMTDLGIAEREGEGGTWEETGTAEYMAPELIQQGYAVGKTVDWWASGVILYEMLTRKVVCTVHGPNNNTRVHYCRIWSSRLTWYTFFFLSCIAIPRRH